MAILGAIVLVLVLLISLLLTVLGLPGNWMMVAAAAIYAFAVAPHLRTDFGWPVVLAMVILAAFGELLEFIAGALGVARGGGSRRGVVMALVGSVVGAIVGMVVGLPIPIVGSILAALLFASVGAMAGAMLGEHSAGRELAHSWRVGKAAFWGRLFGTVAKTLVGAIMVAVAAIAAFV